MKTYNIRKNVKSGYNNIKIIYHSPLDSGRVVSQTFPGNTPTKKRKIVGRVAYSFPQIAIQKENQKNDKEVLLVNGCWDTTNRIPNIVAEMHNVKTEDFETFQNGGVFKNENDTGDLVSPSPRGSDSGIESDCTDGNLSWLLNYKIHELPPVPDNSFTENLTEANCNNLRVNHNEQHAIQVRNEVKTAVCLKEDANSLQIHRYSGPKKPPFTYTELIEHALSEKGELTVSGIYQWISDHFPFYKQNDDRWKNSVRHNLSINPHFRKGGKAVHGAGHLWTIAQKDDKKTWQIRQRVQQFIQNTYKDPKVQEQEDFDKELQAATDSILGEIQGHTQDIDQSCNTRCDDIQVEYINLPEGTNGLEDFLSPPVSKQEIVNECGLGGDFFITDINPNALGVNLVGAETVAEDGLYDEMSFEYYQLKE